MLPASARIALSGPTFVRSFVRSSSLEGWARRGNVTSAPLGRSRKLDVLTEAQAPVADRMPPVSRRRRHRRGGRHWRSLRILERSLWHRATAHGTPIKYSAVAVLAAKLVIHNFRPRLLLSARAFQSHVGRAVDLSSRTSRTTTPGTRRRDYS